MKYDVIIIGGGVLGCATAYYLSTKGQKVLIVDQFLLQNSLNSSYDATRILKFAHGNDVLKTKMAISSVTLYKALEKISGKQLFFPFPAFFPGKTDHAFLQEKQTQLAKQIKANYIGNDTNDHHIAAVNLLEELGYSASLLTQKDIKTCYPQFMSNFGMVDENAGILEASSTVDVLINLIKQQGVTILENKKVTKIQNHQVFLENGEIVTGEKIVVACGAWTRKLFEKKIPILPIKKELIYILPKSGSKTNFPIFLDINTGFYGVPMHNGNGIKIGNHYIGKEVDPDKVNRIVSKAFVRETRRYLQLVIPELADGKIIKTKVCMYEMPPDEEFILDKISKNTYIIAGAGQAFKFAPLFGKLMSELVLGEKVSFDISRFSLKRFTE